MKTIIKIILVLLFILGLARLFTLDVTNPAPIANITVESSQAGRFQSFFHHSKAEEESSSVIVLTNILDTMTGEVIHSTHIVYNDGTTQVLVTRFPMFGLPYKYKEFTSHEEIVRKERETKEEIF